MMGWKVPTYVVEPEESYVLYNFISFPTPEFKSLKLMVSHIKLKKYRFPGQYEDASQIGSNHMQRLEDKRDILYYTKPNFKKWVDDSTLRLLTEYYSQFLKSNMNIRMTSLLKLTVAHSTRHSFRPQTNSHPFEKLGGGGVFS